ncbi:hypothetical protein [Geobacillus thermodenitrificans]|uniref:Uncharacterized protein n=1 Tax=Geobacillus thermodenitrificans TaxID=33940 RepID=A0ABY9Q7L5_GEOTD|nr:hypothetical protein [Geobacillus thermodenitrificans]WMV74905.1 hypothetical protein HSX42_11435 [Geobacillus thermodenitrificans]
MAKGNPERQKHFKNQMPLIKNGISSNFILLFIDVIHIGSYHALCTTLARGEPPKANATFVHHAHVQLSTSLVTKPYFIKMIDFLKVLNAPPHHLGVG